ncbi:hypothetical protein AC578_1257 [Pseudocercospora eumusae]|uniref:Uncharacterized protein n=1 Tax=Pseudocercospora eumusae TaxID=321146 RepID=A0A139H8A3_9PEZI|nr:hypothetical protein AC578_1257 [Pseudocercospora eumusae]KXS98694.1 hypothetical protein AC578_1257 [Pseudocercospora eumusae]
MGGNDQHENRLQVAQGLLYMIDTAPKATLDSQQQLTMIQEHLREHAYYKRSLRGNRQAVLRTEHDCKQLLVELASESKLKLLKQANEKMLDVIFRVGSSKLSETVLTRYQYHHATFDPTSLPGPPLDTSHLGAPCPQKTKKKKKKGTLISDVDQLKKGYETVIDATNRPRYSPLPRYSTTAEVFAELNGDKKDSIRLPEDNEGESDSQSDRRTDHTSRISSLTEPSWRDAQSTISKSQSSALKITLRKSSITGEPETLPRRPTLSPLAASSPKPVMSNLAEWESGLSNLNKRINKTVSSLFTNLSLPISQTSPYLTTSAFSLRSVLALCFGDDFQSACATLRDNDTFSAFNITQCLIAALIHEHLLKEKLDWQRALCIQLGWSKIEDVQRLFTMLRDPLQNAIAREKHLPRRFAETILKSTNDDHDRAVLPRFTHQFTRQLTSDLTPYIEILLQIAILLNQDAIHTNETWHAGFGEDAAAIVTSAADLKLKLTSSELEHCFFWPTAGEQFNGDIHTAINASGNCVAFTVMPGLRLVEGESTAVLPAHVVCCSRVEEEQM